MDTTSDLRQRLFVLLVVFLVVVGAAKATTCPFCVNGRVVSGTCTCQCIGLYLPPTCSFTATENASMTIYTNMSASRMNSQHLMQAIAVASGLPTSALVYDYALNVSSFGATSVHVTMPGYAVQRLVLSIQLQDPWAQQFAVVSAYPAVPIVAAAARTTDLVLYQGKVVTVTISGVAWLGACAVLVAAITLAERHLLQNRLEATVETEESTDGPSTTATRRRQLMYERKGTGESTETPADNHHTPPGTR